MTSHKFRHLYIPAMMSCFLYDVITTSSMIIRVNLLGKMITVFLVHWIYDMVHLYDYIQSQQLQNTPCTHMHAHAQAHKWARTYTHTHAHTHTHTHTHAHAHTHTQSSHQKLCYKTPVLHALFSYSKFCQALFWKIIDNNNAVLLINGATRYMAGTYQDLLDIIAKWCY